MCADLEWQKVKERKQCSPINWEVVVGRLYKVPLPYAPDLSSHPFLILERTHMAYHRVGQDHVEVVRSEVLHGTRIANVRAEVGGKRVLREQVEERDVDLPELSVVKYLPETQMSTDIENANRTIE